MEEEDLDFLRLFTIISDLLRLFTTHSRSFATFHDSICKHSKPYWAKATQTKLTQNAAATLLLLSQQKNLVPKHGLTFLIQLLLMIGFICRVNSYSCLFVSMRKMDGKRS
jgi:hypothetical protein